VTWGSVTISTATYTGVGASTATWGATSVAVSPPPWAVLSSLTTSVDVGVDFVLRVHDEIPMYVSADRPLVVRDVQPEGSP